MKRMVVQSIARLTIILGWSLNHFNMASQKDSVCSYDTEILVPCTVIPCAQFFAVAADRRNAYCTVAKRGRSLAGGGMEMSTILP